MYVCMYVWMDVWMYGCMDVCMYVLPYREGLLPHEKRDDIGAAALVT